MTRLIATCAAALAASVGSAQTFNFALNQAASTANWSAQVAAPFQTIPSGTSFLIGSYDAINNPTGTRTIPGLAGGNTSANTPVPITAGGISAEGSSGSEAVHPSGTFRIAFDTEALTCSASAINLDLLGGATPDIATTVGITYSSFRTRQPTCVLIGGIPINLELGGGQIVAIAAAQTNASDPGVLTAAGGNAYNFTIPVLVTLSIEAMFNGLPVPIDPQTVPLVLTGTATLNGDSASITSSVVVDENQKQPGPFVVPAIPFVEPVCSGNLLINLTLASVTVDLYTSAELVADGTPYCAVDFDGDGFVTGADFDLFVHVFESGC